MDMMGAIFGGKGKSEENNAAEVLEKIRKILAEECKDDEKDKKNIKWDEWDEMEFYEKNIQPKVDELNKILIEHNIPHLFVAIPKANGDGYSGHNVCFIQHKAIAVFPLAICGQLLAKSEENFAALMAVSTILK